MGFAELYRIAATIDLLPKEVEAAIFAVWIVFTILTVFAIWIVFIILTVFTIWIVFTTLIVFTGGAVEVYELVLVDLLVLASVSLGRAVVNDGDADVGVAAFAEAVGYCELEGELGVGCDFGGGEGGSGNVGVIEIY